MGRLLPFLIVLLLAAVLAVGLLNKQDDGAIDTRRNGQELASFSVPMLHNNQELFAPEIFAKKVVLINVFASWCEACMAEHEALLKLAATDSLNLYGLAWKDTPENIEKYLAQRGNPFKAVWVDTLGKTTIPLALTGVPETFILDRNGKIAFHYKTALTDEVIQKTILPLVEKLKNADGN